VIKEIRLPEELEKSLPVVDQERVKAEAANFVSKRQAIEWVGMVLESFAQAKGKKVKEIQKEIESDKSLQREFLDYIKDVNIRLEEAERGSLVDIRVNGAQGLEKALLELIAAWKRIPTEKKKPEKKEEKRIKGFTPDYEEWKAQTEPFLKKKP
jgi:hypothetical protein